MAETDYNKFAEEYSKNKEDNWRIYMERYTILKNSEKLNNLSILDLACGSGTYSRIFKDMGAKEVVGVDISSKMINIANEYKTKVVLR